MVFFWLFSVIFFGFFRFGFAFETARSLSRPSRERTADFFSLSNQKPMAEYIHMVYICVIVCNETAIDVLVCMYVYI